MLIGYNILLIQPVVDSTEESKNILDKFYDENNPQKPDNDKKDILDLSLGVPNLQKLQLSKDYTQLNK